jgi:hypothetical protein
MSRGEKRARKLLAEAERLARKNQQPTAIGLVAGCTGLAEFVFGQFKSARGHLERAERLFQESCVGVAWEIDVTRLFALICLNFEGQLAELARRLGPIVLEAEDRGDLFAATSIRVATAHIVALAADRPAEARRGVDEAMRRWSQTGFQMQHRYALLAHADIDLYEGRAAEAHRRLEAAWPAMEKALLLRIKQQRLEMLAVRARAALGAAAQSEGRARQALIGQALRAAARIERDAMAWATPIASLIRAGAAHLEGQSDIALAGLARAEAGFVGAEMALYAAIARRRRGELLGGDEGAALVASADEALAAATVKNVSAVTALLSPGFGGS